MSIPFNQRPTCTIREACEATGIGRSKLYEEITADRIATTNVGTRRLVIVPSLLEFLKPTPPALTRSDSTQEAREAA